MPEKPDRATLRALAQELDAVAQVGKAGLTPALKAEVDRALTDHELIKVRFMTHRGEREPLARELAEATGAEVIQVIGNVAILYRMREGD